MNLRWIDSSEVLGTRRGEVVVCIPVYGGHELFVSCLKSVLEHTGAEVPILICDDAGPDARSSEFVRRLGEAGSTEHRVFYLRREQNVGFPVNANGAFATAAPADVVLLNSDCQVADGWLDGMRAAAYTDSRVATATALTNHGTIVSVPDRGRPAARLAQEWDFDQAAAAIGAHSLHIRPRLPTAIGHCVFIRRSALELVGDFDPIFSPGYGEEVDFSQRCLQVGLCHVLADEVLVLHQGGGSFSSGGPRNRLQDHNERIIAARYPYYHEAVQAAEDDHGGPLPRALGAARRALKGMSVIIDARILGGPMTGTQLHVLELIAALSRTREARIHAIVSDRLSPYAVNALQAMPEVVPLTRSQATATLTGRHDLVHRPFQINSAEDLRFLASLAERLVITNQDLIGYHNPSYFKNFEAWNDYRRLTRSALAMADQVVFFSAHARDDALAEDLVDPGRAHVVHIGVDHVFPRGFDAAVPPRGAERLPEGAEAIVCIGTDFRHKNRIFALRLLEALQRGHDWRGYLLLVGPHVSWGASTPEEAEMMALRPAVARATLDFAAVTEAEKAWLLQRAQLMLYPTVHEGFGLIPFEAADHAIPCLWAKGTSLSEILPDSAAQLIPWSAEESAAQALELLRDQAARERNLAALRAAATKLTWDRTAAQLLAVYRRTCDEPSTPVGALERRDGVMSGALSEDGMRLVGPGGLLPREAERPLLALATHPQIGRPVFQAISAGYRAAYRVRRFGRGKPARPGP